MLFRNYKIFQLTFAILLIGISAIGQLPKHYGRKLEKTYPIDLQRHLFNSIKYPNKAEHSYTQGNTIAYFKVYNRKITLLSVAPKLTIDFKNEIIKAFKNFETNDLKNGFYGLPINFRIANVVTKIHNAEIAVHKSYIDLPYLEILLGIPSCDPGAPHLYCKPNTLHAPYELQIPPVYPNDDYRGFIKFIKANVNYPKAAIENQVQGNVYVSFVIEKDGSLSSAKVERSLGYGTDEEAIRVLKLSQKWKPGYENGKPVRTIYRTHISFQPDRPFKNPKPIKIYQLKQLKYPPQYPGGEERLIEFIKTNINYSNLTNKQIKGIVVISAVIEMDGSLSQLKAIDNLGYGTKKEALRVVSKLKRWNPGMENGIPTRTQIAIPVKFNP
ncbi:MAG: TonB family protein [Pedobacter sp.]|uniref:TonB family protein n=1 Tax=Pedobacter sp. TaxID=1411316 RepID=UPI00280837DB|nr:TonB family protein [Pedobacter sp.]MDQ8006390.1 TonB family protein [Pedobacter sp.]